MLQQKQLNADGTITPSPFLNPTLLGEIGQGRYTLSNGISTYNALQLVLQERFTNGLQAQVNYTWSKCLSDTPGFFGQFGDNVPTEAQTIAGWAFPQNPYDQGATTASVRKISLRCSTGMWSTNSPSDMAGVMPAVSTRPSIMSLAVGA